MYQMEYTSSAELLRQIKAAEAKFEADRNRALSERFERAVALNTRVIRAERAATCRRHVFVGDTK